MPEVKKPYLGSLQILRFIAAGLVLVGHVQHDVLDLGIGGEGYQEFRPVVWGAGVDIFFIISGFIIYFLTYKHFNERGYTKEFLRRRFIRVAPAYWLFTTLMLVAMTVFRSRVSHAEANIAHVLASYTFLPWPRADGDLRPILSLGWTLNYEVFFYLVFAAVLWLPRARAMQILSVGFVLGVLFGSRVPEPFWMIRFWTSPIILEFLLGIGLAQAYLSGWKISAKVGAVAAIAGVLLMVGVKAAGVYETLPRPVWAGIPALLICGGFILAPEPKSSGRLLSGLEYGGDISYSIYLSHGFTVNCLAIVWQRLGLKEPVLFVVVAVLASIFAAHLVYQFCEKPMLNFFHSATQPRRASAQAPA